MVFQPFQGLLLLGSNTFEVDDDTDDLVSTGREEKKDHMLHCDCAILIQLDPE